MSRSGYSDDCDGWGLIRWRGAVQSAIRGKRGQAFLREMLAALDALPEPRLIDGAMVRDDGVCALGAVAKSRRMNVGDLDVYEQEDVAEAFGIARAMAAEIAYENDERRYESPEHRFQRIRAWVAGKIRAEVSDVARR